MPDMSEIADRAELEAYLLAQRLWFEEWRSPNEFRARIVTVDRAVRSEFLFRLPRANWVQEALTLSLFAIAVDSPGVRLNRNDPPDAFMRLNGAELPIEIAEVLDPDRKRGDEYHPSAPTLVHREASDTKQEAARGEGQLAAILAKKAEKSVRYPPGTLLLLYINLGLGYRPPSAKLRRAVEGTRDFRSDNIRAVCIIWGTELFGPPEIVPNGLQTFDWRELDR
jgi:hypothetical protein